MPLAHVHHIQVQPSYSRTYPVMLTHPSSRLSITGLAIIDDQSGITFVDPEAVDMLNVINYYFKSLALSTRTFQGISGSAPCQTINGLTITALGDDSSIVLLNTYVQNLLSSAINQKAS